MSSGRPPTLWCDLIVAATPSSPPPDSITSGVERALDEEARVPAELARLFLEDADELLADRSCASPPGRSTPSSRARKRSSASTCTSGTWKCPPKVSTTCSASSLRSSPWSTKTQVSWSPTALCTSSAATAESTPPESAADHALAARPGRGCARPAPRSRPPASRRAARRRRRRGSSSAAPRRAACARPRGGTGRRRACARGSSKAATGVDGEPATTRAPSGGAVTESRWLIHTVCSPGRSREERAPGVGLELRLAELGDAGAVDARRRARAPSAACRSRCRASGCRARRARDRRAARRRRRPRPGRRRGSARAAVARAHRSAEIVCGTSSE